MRVITVRLSERQYAELKRLVESGEFRSISDVVGLALVESISKRKLRWGELRGASKIPSK